MTAVEGTPGRSFTFEDQECWASVEILDPEPAPLFPPRPSVQYLLWLRYRLPLSETDDTVAAFRAASSPF